jgi:hypothetical protein
VGAAPLEGDAVKTGNSKHQIRNKFKCPKTKTCHCEPSAASGRNPKTTAERNEKMRKKGTRGACSLSLPFFVFFRFFRLYALSFFRSFLPEKQDVAPLECSEAISHTAG